MDNNIAPRHAMAVGRMRRLGAEIIRHRAIYTLVLPGLVWYLIFAYGPMGGLSLAFKTYRANLGIWASPWVGMQNFEYVLKDPSFWRSVWRTLSINLGRLLFEFPVPILLSLMLNEVRIGRSRKVLQTVYTFPHFLSWIIVSSVMINFLSAEGLVNSIIRVLGGSPVNFLGNPNTFQAMLYVTQNWKGAGWSAIVYLAAISAIDMDQYEAAEIDGASRLQRVVHITLPNIQPTIVVLFILQCGSIMSAGFDQIFNLSNVAVRDVAETLDMFIYRVTFKAPPDFGFSMAVSLFRSVINMLLLVLADRGAKWMGGNGLFG